MIKLCEISGAPFNGKTWDGAPFTSTDDIRLLQKYIAADRLRIHTKTRETDYALWEIDTQEDIAIAEPGDVIWVDEKGENPWIERYQND